MKRLVTVLIGALFIGLLLTCVTYGWWLSRVHRAESVFAEGRYDEAQQQFKEANSGWELTFLPGLLVEKSQVRIALNLMQIGYVLDEFEQTFELLEGPDFPSALLEVPEYHFWLGNLLMLRAVNNPDTNLTDTLGRCREEYLETLHRDPEFWDAKYNYEYVNRLLEQLNSRDSHQEGEIKLLLEKMRTDIPQQKKKLPPEKRS